MKTFRLTKIFVLVAAALLAAVSPAAAQWTQVPDAPSSMLASVSAKGDTIIATGSNVIYLSTNGGSSWKTSAVVAAGVGSVQTALIRNGRIYVGTFGQGVFTSDNLGDSWAAFNQGLVGGILNTQLDIDGLVLLNDTIYAATAGDGPWKRNLAPPGTWTHFSNIFEENSASNMNAIAVGGTRLLACAGANGQMLFRDPADLEWTVSNLNNTGLAPAVTAFNALYTGAHWVVGTNIGVFHSPQGQEPWTGVNVGLGPMVNVVFALRAPRVFASFGTSTFAAIEYSDDNGATWQPLDTLPSTFIFGLAVNGNTLYAARGDGLWRRSLATVATKPATWGNVKALYRGSHK
jgi:hypothetical protein